MAVDLDDFSGDFADLIHFEGPSLSAAELRARREKRALASADARAAHYTAKARGLSREETLEAARKAAGRVR